MNKNSISKEYMNKYTYLGAILLGCFLYTGSVSAQAAKPDGKLSTKLSDTSVARSAQPQALDSIVAVVNNDVITQNELNERIIAVEKQLKRNNTPLPSREEMRGQVLERMIVDRAQMQLAKENGIRIDDVQLDRAMARIAEQNKMNTQSFRDAIEKEGVSYAQFREDIRNEITLARLREREVDSRVQVSDGEVDNFLAEQGVAAKEGAEEYKLAQILVRIPEGASPEIIEKQRLRVEQAMREIRSGGDFAKASATYSDAPEALKGGELDYRPLDRLPQLFVEAIQPLKPGQVAKIVKSPVGFHIIKLIDKRTGTAEAQTALGDVTRTHARHILIKVNQLTTESEARRRLVEIKERLDNKAAKFEDLAKQLSQDGSATKGGDLGWLHPGETVPEFERAMDALSEGQVSEPIQSQFGFHLIQVIERKKEAVSNERQRIMARQAIRERKLGDEYQEWLRQLRDRAYVEIKEPEGKS